MNEIERAALVEELAEAIRPGVRYAVELNGEMRDKIDEEIAWALADPQIPGIVDDLMPIIERLLADEYQKGYSQRFDDEKRFADRAAPGAFDLDAVLYSVPHDTIEMNYLRDVDHPGDGFIVGMRVLQGRGRYRIVTGTGPTRMDAIRNAVAKARKERDDE